MQQLTSNTLVNTRSNDETITFIFEAFWTQDDIEQLYTFISAQLDDFKLLEHQLGADRESYRLLWQEHYFCLHFDVYSQSAWLSAEDHLAQQKMPALFKLYS
jgi:hypothetical protein